MSKYLRNAPFILGATLAQALVAAGLMFVLRPMVPEALRIFVYVPSIIFLFIGFRLYRSTMQVTKMVAYMNKSIPGQFTMGFKHALLCFVRGTWHEIKLLGKQ